MMQIRKANDEEPSYIVEGYASTFKPYLLFKDEELGDIYERIDPSAFDGADMSDVLFLYNHEGAVMARQKNNTLSLSVDADGLKVIADLRSTAKAREMYESINAGLVDQMSFAFTVADEHFDRESHTRVITRMRKVYDVSAVDRPANPTTSISCRSLDGVIEEMRAERRAEAERERALAELELLLALKGE